MSRYIIQNTALLYLLGFVIAFFFSLSVSPVFRWIAIRFNVLDHPITSVKTHREPTPYLGGAAIALSFIVTLTVIRFLSTYPRGTLRPIQGIFFGGGLVLLLGLVDDIVAGGL